MWVRVHADKVRCMSFYMVRWLVVTMVAGCCLAGCGYRLTGSGHLLPGPEDRVIEIPIVTNNSFKPAIETRFTNNIIDEFGGRGFRVVAGEKAPRTLKVVIVSYASVPVAYNARDQVQIYRAVITVEAVLRDNVNGNVLWKNVLSWGEEYPASADIALQTNNEDTAINEATHRLAQLIHQNLIQDF